MSENYYDILGVSRDANEDDIKRAYKKLALKTHPDKNGGDDSLFKKINLAYETLSDPDKRSNYDNPHSQMPHFDMFERMFRGMNVNLNMNMNMKMNNNIKRNNQVYRMNITLKDVHVGLVKTLKLKINKVCFECKKICNTCNGSGRMTKIQQAGPFIQQIHVLCNACGGKSDTNSKDINCKYCHGNGEIISEEMIKVEIPQGVNSGYGIIYNKLGEQAQNKNEEAGDFIVEVMVNDHPFFTRENDNLIYRTKLTLSELFLGKQLTIAHFDGDINVNTNMFGIIDPNKRYHLKGRGLGGKGDLIFVFEIIYPEKVLDSYERESLRNVFKNIGLI